jgi:acyl-coenzyme A thioesterase PaaI-like protein
LAEELRAIHVALATSDLDAAALSEAAERARGIRALLDGERRRRWYEVDPSSGEPAAAVRSAYFELSPIRGVLNPVAPPMAVDIEERADGQRVVVGRARLSMTYEGPPRGVHGGWVAALFDEVLGAVQGIAGVLGVTAILTVKYREVTPLDTDLRFEAWIDSRRGRRIVAKATCHAGDTLTADAEGIFIEVDFDEVQARMRDREAS